MNLEKAAEKIVKSCMSLRKKERFLVVYDENKKNIADSVFSAGKHISSNAELFEIPVAKVNGEEPPADCTKKMADADVIVITTTKSLSHTKARRDANSHGARIASMPNIIEETMLRAIDIDYDALKIQHDKIREILQKSEKVRITTSIGTDIVTSVHATRGDPGILHKPGSFGNLPTGEVDSGVKEGMTNGIVFIDASFAGIGKLDEPLKLVVKDGYVISVEGKDADKLKPILDPIGKNAYKIAELGIGTNPKAVITGNVLEDEKVLGTAHFAVGNDLSYDGTNDVPLHLDAVFMKPTIYVDDKMIMKDGKIII